MQYYALWLLTIVYRLLFNALLVLVTHQQEPTNLTVDYKQIHSFVYLLAMVQQLLKTFTQILSR